MKRIVTGHSTDGKSVIVSHGEPPRTMHLGDGVQVAYCWTTQDIPAVLAGGEDPTLAIPAFYPAPSGTTYLLVRLPGNYEGPMHTTDTVDYVTIISGEVCLVLDGGAEERLVPGDCVVQNGTLHSWHNRNPEPCVFTAAMVAAKRTS